MTSTTQVFIGADRWIKVSDGLANVTVYKISTESVEVLVSKTDPSSASFNVGTILSGDGAVFEKTNLLPTEKVYVRAAPGLIAEVEVLATPKTAEKTKPFSIIDALKNILMSGASFLTRVPVETANVGNKLREAFETYDPVNGGRWSQTLANGDIITLGGNTASASYLIISKSPLTVGESQVWSIPTWDMPFEGTVGFSASQRTLGQEFSIEYVSDEPPIVTADDLQISSIQQVTTTLTVGTVLPHGYKPGVRIGIRDCADSRFNYTSLVVATTPTANTFTVTAGPMGNLPSVTAGPFATGFVYQRSALGQAPNGANWLFENASVTQASTYIRSESGDYLPSGTIAGNHVITTATSASAQPVVAALAHSFQPNTEFRLTQYVDGVQWSDAAMDNIAAATHRRKSMQIVPDITHDYRIRFRATNNASLTRPIAKIVSATKTGTTTATVVTDVPHGLTTADFIQTYGARDQTNFANLAAATAVASIVDANTFTVVWGLAVTATTFGGSVTRVNGGQLLQGLVSNGNVQSISRANNVVSIVTLAAVTGLLNGDTIEFHGGRSAVDGSDVGLDGAYMVREIQTTTVFLDPIGNTPTGADVVSTNCGGVLIRRTDYRLHYVRVMDFERERVEIMPRPAGDISTAIPVAIQNSPAMTVSSGTVTTVSTVTSVGTAGTPPVPATPYFLNSAASTNAALIITGTSGLQAFHATNIGAGIAIVKLYNKATAPTVGTDVPEMIIPVPAAAAGLPGTSPPLSPAYIGQRFPLGLGIAITGAMADSDTTAVAAGQVKVKLTRTV